MSRLWVPRTPSPSRCLQAACGKADATAPLGKHWHWSPTSGHSPVLAPRAAAHLSCALFLEKKISFRGEKMVISNSLSLAPAAFLQSLHILCGAFTCRHAWGRFFSVSRQCVSSPDGFLRSHCTCSQCSPYWHDLKFRPSASRSRAVNLQTAKMLTQFGGLLSVLWALPSFDFLLTAFWIVLFLLDAR